MTVIENKHNFGETVYVISDPEQKARVITALAIRPPGYIQYELCVGDVYTWHPEMVLSKEKNILV